MKYQGVTVMTQSFQKSESPFHAPNYELKLQASLACTSKEAYYYLLCFLVQLINGVFEPHLWSQSTFIVDCKHVVSGQQIDCEIDNVCASSAQEVSG